MVSSGITENLGTSDSLVTGLRYTAMTESCLKVGYFSHPSWNLSKNLLLTEAPYTTPVKSFLGRLENPSLISSSNSPTVAFTTLLKITFQKK